MWQTATDEHGMRIDIALARIPASTAPDCNLHPHKNHILQVFPRTYPKKRPYSDAKSEFSCSCRQAIMQLLVEQVNL